MNDPNSSETTYTDGVYHETIKHVVPTFISRSQLPSPCPTKSISIWSVLKRSIGKDLSRVTVPIVFNEPLSFHQRLAEYMEYVSLIKKAAACSDPIKRIEFVTAFALSNLASSTTRLSKPFNPLLYETYELSHPGLGFKFVAEQVSHHPPVSAFHAHGDEFVFYGNVEPKVKFWGRSLEVTPQAAFTLVLTPFNETYTWQASSCCIYNIYMGKPYMSITSTLNIKCPQNDLQTEIQFASATSSRHDPMLHGELYQGCNPIRSIYGSFTEYIASTPYPTFQKLNHQWKKEYRLAEKSGNTDLVTLFPDSRLLWRAHKKPPGNKDYYNMTYYAFLLNEMVSDSSQLPRTDARFRMDIRLMEDGNMDAASHQKEHLENKQRARAKQRSNHNAEPRWFTLGRDERSERTGFYIFNGNYWKREYSRCEDIF